MRRFWEWLFIAAVFAMALTVFGLQAPARLKSTVPMPLLIAAVAGLVISGIAERLHQPVDRFSMAATAAMIALAIVGLHLGNWSQQAKEWRFRRLEQLQSEASEELAQILSARRLLEAAEIPEASEDQRRHRDLMNSLEQSERDLRERSTTARFKQRVREETSFWSWVNQRRLAHGTWSAPWPAVFTFVESGICVSLGAWIFYRRGQRETASDENSNSPTG